MSDDDFYDAREFEDAAEHEVVITQCTNLKIVEEKHDLPEKPLIDPKHENIRDTEYTENEDVKASSTPSAEPPEPASAVSSESSDAGEPLENIDEVETAVQTEHMPKQGEEEATAAAADTDSDQMFVVVNKDTGEVFDIRQIDDQIPIDKYTMFPGNFVPPPAPQTTEQKPLKQITGNFFRRKAKMEDQSRPNAVQVFANKKAVKEFDGLVLAQTLALHEGPIWAMQFSCDGAYLCTGGQDTILRIWIVEERPEQSQSSSENGGDAEKNVEKHIFGVVPRRAYQGHTGPIVDLSWSRSNFILSSSMDKTVRLWHVSKEECLHFFQHPDSVPAVDFHPKEDRYFLSGCFDNKVRIWDITDGRVVSWTPTHAMITAANFLPCGSMVVVGLLNGQCTFYQTERLVYYTQIECRNQHGPLKRGRKVTGVQFSPSGKHLLVTTNDSRMRLFCMDDYSRSCKYKGMVNDNLQIKGHFSQNGEHIICGSENGQVYIWNTNSRHAATVGLMKGSKLDRNACYEHFSACSSPSGIVTVALFAPAHLGKNEGNIDSKACTRFVVTASYDGKIKVFENEEKK